MTPNELLARAREAFNDGQWGEAVKFYHELDLAIQRGGVVPGLWSSNSTVHEIQRELDSHPTWTPIRSGEPSRGSW